MGTVPERSHLRLGTGFIVGIGQFSPDTRLKTGLKTKGSSTMRHSINEPTTGNAERIVGASLRAPAGAGQP
jgi:hypothetical protein